MQIFRDGEQRCYHIRIAKGDVSPNILCCGSPERVAEIAERLSNVRLLSKNRGLLTMRGDFQGVDLTLVATGMGAASAGIAIPEILDSLENLKAPITLLRLGTAGSMQPYVKVGDLAVAKGAVRDESTTQRIAPLEFPATASVKITLAALCAAQASGFTLHKDLWHGMLHVKDELYFTEAPHHSPIAATRLATLQSYQQMGVVATEMEYSVLPILSEHLMAHHLRLSAEPCRIDYGCIDLIVSPHHDPRTPATTSFPPADPSRAIEVALQTMVLKQQWDLGEGMTELTKLLPQL